MAIRRLTFSQIADDIAERIASGEYEPNGQLPSNRQLAELYSVSVATIDKVHIVLRNRGLTYGVPGRGVFVVDRDS